MILHVASSLGKKTSSSQRFTGYIMGLFEFHTDKLVINWIITRH